MANTKVQWSGKINIEKKKLVERKRKLISASIGCNRAYPCMASQEVVLWLRARGQKQNGVLASKFWRLLSLLRRLIESSEEQINSASWDASEFLVRRLEEYEQTLSTLIARFSEAYGQANSQQTCIAQLHHLLNRTTSLRAHFQQRCLVYWIEEDENEGQNGILHLERSESPGRPRLAISREQLDALHRDCGFCWNDIAWILRVSNRTFRRRRHEFGMHVVGREFSNISDTEIDNLVRQVQEVTPSAGLRMVQGSLRERGLVVQRMHVLLSLRRVDPVTTTLRNARRIIRRSYNVPCPNSLW